MRAFVRCSFDGIPEGAVVEVLALAIAGDVGRTLVRYEGRTARVPNEAFLDVEE